MLDTQLYGTREYGLKPTFIYGLVDPETGDIRYIGKSIRPAERLRNHINETPSNCHRSHWLRSLRAKSLEPELVIIEEIVGEWPWQHSERYWIAYGRRNGWPLTNNTAGGDGVPGLPAETRARMAAVWKGRKHSPESVEKIRAVKTGVKHSAETRARMSNAHRGRAMTWGSKIGAVLKKLSAADIAEIGRLVAEGHRVKDLAVQFGVHRTTISKVNMGTYDAR